MQHGGPPGIHCLPEGRLEVGVRRNSQAQRAGRIGHSREIDRAEVRSQAGLAAPQFLMPPDRAVTTVVENDRHDVGPLPHGRLELGHRHREPAVTGQGYAQAPRAGKRCGDRSGKTEAHRPRSGADEGARALEPESAGDPSPEVACVCGDDRLGR